MASIQKITLSALRDIPFNKLVLTQSNVPGLRGRRRRPSGTALSSPDSAVPWRARRRRDCDPVGLRPPRSQSRRIPLILVVAPLPS